MEHHSGGFSWSELHPDVAKWLRGLCKEGAPFNEWAPPQDIEEVHSSHSEEDCFSAFTYKSSIQIYLLQCWYGGFSCLTSLLSPCVPDNLMMH